jgi:hypothetical protein
MLSHEPITSPLRKKSRTTFRLHVVDSEEDEDQTFSYDIKGGGGKELNAIAITW